MVCAVIGKKFLVCAHSEGAQSPPRRATEAKASFAESKVTLKYKLCITWRLPTSQCISAFAQETSNKTEIKVRTYPICSTICTRITAMLEIDKHGLKWRSHFTGYGRTVKSIVFQPAEQKCGDSRKASATTQEMQPLDLTLDVKDVIGDSVNS